jgi:hypothetical protein
LETREDYQQTSLNWLNGKVVLFIKSCGSHFVIVSCRKYDDDIEVEFTGDKRMRKRKVKRSIEPGRIHVFDFDLKAAFDEDDGTWSFDKMSVVMRRDDQFFCDTFIGDEQDISTSYFYTKYRGVYKKWPYFVMQGLQTRVSDDDAVQDGIFVQATSIYEIKVIFRVEFPVLEPKLPIGVDPDSLSEEELQEM